MTHASPDAEKPRSSWIDGRATFTIVTSRTIISIPVQSTYSASRRRRWSVADIRGLLVVEVVEVVEIVEDGHGGPAVDADACLQVTCRCGRRPGGDQDVTRPGVEFGRVGSHPAHDL